MSDSFMIPRIVAHQAPLSMGFSRKEYWSALPFSSPRDLPDPGIKPASPALQADSLPLNHQGSFIYTFIYIYIYLFLNLSDHGFITVSINYFIQLHKIHNKHISYIKGINKVRQLSQRKMYIHIYHKDLQTYLHYDKWDLSFTQQLLTIIRSQQHQTAQWEFSCSSEVPSSTICC